MNTVTDFFKEKERGFTIYVVEQLFVTMRGNEYFKSFRGKDNLIDSDYRMEKHLAKILKWIQKNVPNIAELIKNCYNPSSLSDIIIPFSKLFAVEEHQAAGPDVIDPIIIQEGKVATKYINQLINLHKNSILQPVIIILLKDNNFERAKKELSNCPHGCNIKFIRNSGDCELYKIINYGAKDVDDFLDAYASQCFSTCSQTKRNILLNDNLENETAINKYGPIILKHRSNLLFDEKNEVKDSISLLIRKICQEHSASEKDEKILRSFECMLRLQKIFCDDFGGENIRQALQLAKFTQNDILKAHVFRYADLIPNITITQKQQLLEKAETIFSDNKIEDHAIYCRNNNLIYQFESEKINPREFKHLQEMAINNVPGLSGMSHILNNTGVAYLMTGNAEYALEFFEKGYHYAKIQDRNVQRLAILSNIMIARTYAFDRIDPAELMNVLSQIVDGMGNSQLPFISARYAMNIISIAFRQSNELGKELLTMFPISSMVHSAFQNNIIGSGQLLLQIKYLEKNYPGFKSNFHYAAPNKIEGVTGKRRDFILRYGLNPFYFCTWL